MITDNDLGKIQLKLDLEKIQLIHKLDILLFPKKIDENFCRKVDELREEIKGLKDNRISLKIIQEGEILDGGKIEFCEQSSNYGSPG